MTAIGAVLFDLYGTLVDLTTLPGVCDAVVPGRGVELAARWRDRQLEATWLRTVMGRWADFEQVTDDALAVAAADLEIDVPVAGLRDAFTRLPAAPGASEAVGRLSAAGLPVGVLSNGTSRMIETSLASAGFDARVAHRLSVDAVRVYKPSPAVYDLACRATGLPAADIGFVTGNAWDAAGAASFGFQVAWLPTSRSVLPAVGAPAVLETTLAEVADRFIAP